MDIAVTGYCGTGSSAVICLLEEYDNCSAGKVDRFTHYEHVPFYTPNGLFDLEYKLLYRNNLHRSDEALSRFRIEMERLNFGHWDWFASYSYIFGDAFLSITDEFLKELTKYEFSGYWSYDFKGTRRTIKGILKDLYIRTFKNGRSQLPLGLRPVLTKDNRILAAFPTEEEFFDAAKRYVRAYLNLFHNGTEHTIYDHLVLPHNAASVPNYFDDDFRLIIVDRDIRDMYVLTKYIWPHMGLQAQYPKNVEPFANFWKRLRDKESPTDDPRVLRIYFEELIYDYDNAVDKLERFLGLDPAHHVWKKQKLQPERSIHNTQNFLIRPEWEEEVQTLAQRLPQYVYSFPYNHETDISNTFDS